MKNAIYTRTCQMCGAEMQGVGSPQAVLPGLPGREVLRCAHPTARPQAQPLPLPHPCPKAPGLRLVRPSGGLPPPGGST